MEPYPEKEHLNNALNMQEAPTSVVVVSAKARDDDGMPEVKEEVKEEF
jgi:hypothetical protein